MCLKLPNFNFELHSAFDGKFKPNKEASYQAMKVNFFGILNTRVGSFCSCLTGVKLFWRCLENARHLHTCNSSD